MTALAHSREATRREDREASDRHWSTTRQPTSGSRRIDQEIAQMHAVLYVHMTPLWRAVLRHVMQQPSRSRLVQRQRNLRSILRHPPRKALAGSTPREAPGPRVNTQSLDQQE
jgi:hypothetical protein